MGVVVVRDHVELGPLTGVIEMIETAIKISNRARELAMRSDGKVWSVSPPMPVQAKGRSPQAILGELGLVFAVVEEAKDMLEKFRDAYVDGRSMDDVHFHGFTAEERQYALDDALYWAFEEPLDGGRPYSFGWCCEIVEGITGHPFNAQGARDAWVAEGLWIDVPERDQRGVGIFPLAGAA